MPAAGRAATAGARSIRPADRHRSIRPRAGCSRGCEARRPRTTSVCSPRRSRRPSNGAGAGPATRRSDPRAGRGAARAQGCARQPRLARERQDQGRGRRRGTGDDRHRGFRGRTVAHAVRLHDALRASAAPHVRAVASARRGGSDLRLQLPGRRLVVERVSRLHLRQRDGMEALAEDRAVRAGGAAAVQSGARAPPPAGHFPSLHRRRHGACGTLRRTIRASRSCPSPARPTRRTPSRRARGRTARQVPARARRQQRHHRG